MRGFLKQCLSALFVYVAMLGPLSLADNVDVNMDGTFSSSAVSLNVANDYEVDIGVMWLDERGGEIKVMDVGPGLSARMDSTSGHRFVARQLTDNQVLHRFTARAGSSSIRIAPPAQASAPASTGPGRVHPLVTLMHGRKSTSVGAKFKSLSSRTLDMYWEDGRDGVPQGTLRSGRESTTNTYEGHVFYFTEHNKKSNEVARVHIFQNQSTYLIRDSPQYTINGNAIDIAIAEEAYQKEYLERTGVQYRHYFGPDGPRDPPSLYMWPADYIGQLHHAESSNGFWHCNGAKDKCQSKEQLNFEMEVVSTHPKVYIIEDFFSEFEANSIIDFAKPRATKSTVGQGDSGGVRKSDTRTSSNTWMSRDASEVSNTLYLRAADLLKIDEKLLTATQNAEDMQVVHYDIGEKYDAHHDWGVAGYPESRYITLLLYLNDMPDKYSGGETAFPKGNGGTGLKISPKRGTAVLFYSLLEDGNGDDLSLHQAVPVTKGEKWLSNFWVWDPKKKLK